MHAVILSAGCGSRMGEHTRYKPKCFIELGGKTLLGWQMDALLKSDIQDITIVRGYLGHLFDQNGFVAIDNPRWQHTNMLSSLVCAAHILRQKTCIVSYADIVYHPQHIKDLCQEPGDIIVCYDILWHKLWKERFDDPLSDAETFKFDGNRLIEIGQRALSIDQINGQYMGLIKFKPQGWQKAETILSAIDPEKIDQLDMTAFFNILLTEKVVINVMPVKGKWCEVDTPSDLYLYRQRVHAVDADGADWDFDWRVKDIS